MTAGMAMLGSAMADEPKKPQKPAHADATDKARLPDMKPKEGESDDAFAERFAEATVDNLNRWLVAHDHAPIEDDRPKTGGEPPAPPPDEPKPG